MRLSNYDLHAHENRTQVTQLARKLINYAYTFLVHVNVLRNFDVSHTPTVVFLLKKNVTRRFLIRPLFYCNVGLQIVGQWCALRLLNTSIYSLSHTAMQATAIHI